MILGDVEETVTTVEIDEETYEEIYKVSSMYIIRCVACNEHSGILWCFFLLHIQKQEPVRFWSEMTEKDKSI